MRPVSSGGAAGAEPGATSGGRAPEPNTTGGATFAGRDAESGRGALGGAAGAGAAAGTGAAGFGGLGVGAAGGPPDSGAGGVATAGGAGTPLAGTGGMGGTCANGSPVDLGPPGADGFALKVQLASDLLDTAPTTVGIVQWSLDAGCLTEAHIDFGRDTTYGMTAPVDLSKPGFRTVLVGMKPEKTYHFRVVAADASRTTTSDDYTLKTGAATTLVSKPTVTVQAADKVEQGFLIGSFWQSFVESRYVAFISDTDGDIVWWYVDPSGMNSSDGIGRARLSADSQDVWLVRGQQSQPVRRVSLDTLEVQVYVSGSPDHVGDTRANHDICAVSGGTMAYLSPSPKNCAIITEIDRDGATRPIFDSTDVTGGACHGNAIRYSKKQDLYVFSDRMTDVFVVDRAGNLQWKLSDKVSGGHDSWGGMQHGVQLLDSSLLVFANEAGGDQEHSQALEFGLDGSVVKKFTSRSGSDYFGDVQRLPNGNTLINYGNGLVQQVDSSDNVVIELAGAASGYTEFRKSLYGPPLDIQE
jgi:hypothetical protein